MEPSGVVVFLRIAGVVHSIGALLCGVGMRVTLPVTLVAPWTFFEANQGEIDQLASQEGVARIGGSGVPPSARPRRPSATLGASLLQRAKPGRVNNPRPSITHDPTIQCSRLTPSRLGCRRQYAPNTRPPKKVSREKPRL